MRSRSLLKGLLVLLGVVFVLWLILPGLPKKHAGWSEPADGDRRFQFSTYEVPETYKFIHYYDSTVDRKKLVAFKNIQTNQYFFIFILREATKIRFESVVLSDKNVVRTKTYTKQFFSGDPNFELRYLTPVLMKKDIESDYADLEIRGLTPESQEQIQTDDTESLIARGKFEDLGFYRKSDSMFWKYPVPVFKSMKELDGAVAIIRNKSTDHVIFAFAGVNALTGTYNHEEFLEIVKSVRFEPKPRGIKIGHSHSSY